MAITDSYVLRHRVRDLTLGLLFDTERRHREIGTTDYYISSFYYKNYDLTITSFPCPFYRVMDGNARSVNRSSSHDYRCREENRPREEL